ncbi:hypothetical protein LTR36_009592 [Oleoguttula mirabilis]|uniref:dolichol kinase n=1 Tax=Oleoguttula mirabilis TaxID=1507867 RepID=A0AAV9J648_9PEZI|nr:hypothetical protein LTR36_009592 [Oleoguttula mirabilis]
MSSRLKPLKSAADQSLSTDHAESLRQFNRTPRPYTHDGVEVSQDVYNGHVERDTGLRDVVSEPGRVRAAEKDTWHGRSGQASIAGSESGTEADDERPNFVKALPPAMLRPRKGLKTGEKNEDALLTPSQLDDEGRRLSRRKPDDEKASDEDAEAEQEKLLGRRLAELARRSSEVALMGVTTACVLCGRGVLQTASQWQRELVSQIVIIATLILAYPVKLSIVDTRAQPSKLWQRFRVPASFDPATVLYPTLLPVLVALSVSPGNPAIILPNIILGLASLPQRLFPRSSRLGGFNAFHWLVSIIPLILSEHSDLTFQQRPSQPYMLKSGPPCGLSSETLVTLYPLHHALLIPLHYLTTTSLLITELHLLSAALINLLLMAASPQMIILKACLWIGGVAMCVCCGPVLRWGVTLARVPRWKLRRPGHSAEERKPLVDAVSELISLQRASAAFRSPETADSDADEDEPPVSIKETMDGVPHLATSGLGCAQLPSHAQHEPKSAIEPRAADGFPPNGVFAQKRPRRNTLPTRESPEVVQGQPISRRKAKSKLLWCLQLTPAQAERRKWLYASYVYVAIIGIVLGPVRSFITRNALHGQEPFGWAVGYLFGQIAPLRSAVDALGLQDWIVLPAAAGDWHDVAPSLPLDVNGSRHILGSANVRLLLIGYWAAVLVVGLLSVFSLTAFVEVDTRRKVFHGVMVAMLVPSIFIDPCYCALALILVLAVFLLLEAVRAGQVPPLGNAIGRFVAPYVDGRDLRGPVVVSHIFLLIGCAVPLWFSLASIDREGKPPWVDWELADNTREVAMIAGVVCVGMGDAAASLIGRRYGRHKWIWVGGKSLEGSAAFVAAVTIGLMAAKAWQVFGGWSDTVRPLQHHVGASGTARFVAAWSVTLVKAVFCACGASFMEAVLTGANDNVVVPVALWLLVKGSRV